MFVLKRLVLALAGLVSFIWRLLPRRLRHGLMTGLFVIESRGDSKSGVASLLLLRDKLNWVINERAMAYGEGEHPKHRLTRYHQFFIDRIKDGERVLDVGCGYGAVARSIATARPGSTVVGVDMNEPRLAQAKASANPKNLSFIMGDATKPDIVGRSDVVVLSNVLEHIQDRAGFLLALTQATGASRFLIRVPLFEREWEMPLRRELELYYFSDDDHKIEHTLPEFRAETAAANLEITEIQTLWGEIWADCRVCSEARA